MVSGGLAAGGVLAVALGAVDAVVEVVGLEDVDEGVEALVHEGPAALVGADDHGKPGVADLMRGDPEELFALVSDAVEDDAGILHADGEAGDVDGGGTGVGKPAAREVLDRVLEVLGGAGPAVVADALDGIDGHGEGNVAGGQRVGRASPSPDRGEIDAGGVPDEGGRSGEDDVAGAGPCGSAR